MGSNVLRSSFALEYAPHHPISLLLVVNGGDNIRNHGRAHPNLKQSQSLSCPVCMRPMPAQFPEQEHSLLKLQPFPGSRKLGASRASNPKDPCTFIVYTWALKLLHRNPFKAQVYTIEVHGSFNTQHSTLNSNRVDVDQVTAAEEVTTKTCFLRWQDQPFCRDPPSCKKLGSLLARQIKTSGSGLAGHHETPQQKRPCLIRWLSPSESNFRPSIPQVPASNPPARLHTFDCSARSETHVLLLELARKKNRKQDLAEWNLEEVSSF